MKTAFVLTALASVCSVTVTVAQLPESIELPDGCVSPSPPAVVINPTAFHSNGNYVTSHSVLKILVVMAQFQGDKWENTNQNWPVTVDPQGTITDYPPIGFRIGCDYTHGFGIKLLNRCTGRASSKDHWNHDTNRYVLGHQINDPSSV